MAYTTDVATAHKHAHGHGHGGGHDNLIREAEAEMNELSWGELMLAGGLAGMVSWTVSRAPSSIPSEYDVSARNSIRRRALADRHRFLERDKIGQSLRRPPSRWTSSRPVSNPYSLIPRAKSPVGYPSRPPPRALSGPMGSGCFGADWHRRSSGQSAPSSLTLRLH
jgi:hypothetical protein